MQHVGLIEVVSLMIGTLVSVRGPGGLLSGLGPELDWVRTQDDFFLGVVSEVGLGSDSGSLFSGACVRSWAGFGLRMTFSWGLCPKLA
ncbi:hypothetical protein C1N70_21975 [Cytobacillus firmus]